MGAHRAEQPRANGWIVFLCAAIATVILVVGGVFATFVWQGRITLFPEPQPTVTMDPGVQPVIDTTYSVLILNGTPDDTPTALVQDRVLAAGWPQSSVVTGNAGDRDFPVTAVYYAVPEAEAAALGLAELFGATTVRLDEDYPFPGTPPTQLTVVIGTDIGTFLAD